MDDMLKQEGLNALFRRLRTFAYKVLEPFDSLFLRANKMSTYPPIALRRYVSSLGFIDGSGQEHYVYLRLLADLKDDSRVLDMGCGCGLLELALEKNRWKGNLVGIDIYKPAIEWCVNSISKRVPSFQFIHADIYNPAYWRTGRYDVEAWLQKFEGSNFDCVIAKSLFTHMLPKEIGIYFSDISKRLRKGGRALLTFFLLNVEQERLQSTGSSSIFFRRPKIDDIYAVRNAKAPTSAVAYDESFIVDLLKSKDLELVGKIHYGNWSGRVNGLSYQDMLIATKR